MTTVNSPSAVDLGAAFTFSQFDPIIGEPSYETLFKMGTQAIRNSETVVIHFPPPYTNISGIFEPPAVYILWVLAPFTRPPYTGDAAHVPLGATILQRQNIQAAYDANI